jgi:hypothetical protein
MEARTVAPDPFEFVGSFASRLAHVLKIYPKKPQRSLRVCPFLIFDFGERTNLGVRLLIKSYL